MILIYGIFSGSFLGNLDDFFHKIMVAEKNFFFQMHNMILQRVK